MECPHVLSLPWHHESELRHINILLIYLYKINTQKIAHRGSSLFLSSSKPWNSTVAAGLPQGTVQVSLCIDKLSRRTFE